MRRLNLEWLPANGFPGQSNLIKNHRHFFMAVATFLALSSSAVSVAAQQPGADKGIPVQIVVGLEPKHGHELPTITKQDVMVYQGRDRRPVISWVPAKGDKAGLALAILIDEGAGISLGTELSEIRTFIGQQAATTLVAVGYMQNGTVFMAQNFTMDHAAAAKSVRLAQGFYGATASPYLSLSDFIKRWPADPAVPRREVLMITSGIDNVFMGTLQNPYVDAAIRDAQCGGVLVYSIYTPSAGHFGHSYYRTYWGQNYLAELSETTGGEGYYLMGPQAPVAFAPYLDELNGQLPNQFLLTFLANPLKKAGTEPVKVTSEIHDVDFVHAEKVCVPASPGQ
ncbi:MAG: hypothetical protein WCA19_14820 [Candidatus Acidiferrales bacterium]